MSIATVGSATVTGACSSLRAPADAGPMKMKSLSFTFPSCWAVSFSHHKLNPTVLAHCSRRKSRRVICEVAIRSDSNTSSSSPSTSSYSSAGAAADLSPSTSSDEADASPKIGARVRVKVPLKVYHVPRVPEVDITGMEGELKQYVGLWKGKRISANLPYKVQFVADVQGRGAVKFFAHLKEDEFDYL